MLSGLLLLLRPAPADASTGINPQLSFEGKIVNADGTNIPDGTYNMEFKIYQDGNSSGTGSTLKWTEDYLISASQGVVVTNGTFQVNLGSITGTLGSSVDWNQSVLWLSMQVGNTSSCTPSGNFTANCGGDGEMTPFIRLTATPYALNTNKLDGLDSSAFGQLASNQAWTGTNTLQPTTNITGLVVKQTSVASPSADIFNVQTANNTNVIQVTGPSANNAAVTISSVGTGALNLQSGSGNINLSPAAGSNVVFSQGAGSNLQLSASAAPTVNQLAITNAGHAVTTANVNGLSINYVGGAAAVESAGERIDLTPGGTSGGTWSGLRIVANGTGAASGVNENGIKLEGPTSPGSGTETGLYIGSGWDIGLDVESGDVNLAGFTSGGNPSDPAAPASSNLAVYAKKVSGRMMLKIKDPSGQSTPLQPALWGNNVVLYAPTSSTTVTGGFGTLWAKGGTGGTVSTVTPSTTSPAISNQIHRTKQLNLVTTTNQDMGIKISAADGDQFWIGNAAGLGGFFFQTRFIVEAWPAATVRVFAGLASGTTAVVASDTVAGDVAGLWHDTTDSASTFNMVTRNNTTTTKAAISLSNAIAAGNAYDFYMYCPENSTTIYYRLDDIVNGVTYEGSTATTLPRNTIFMGPQVEMSNGTANITVSTVGIGVNRIYVESDH